MLDHMQISDARIYQWISRASAPRERLNQRAFAPLAQQNDVLVADRLKQWRAALDHSALGRDQILKHRGLSEAMLATAVLDVAVVDPAALPQWAKAIHHLLRLWADLHADDPDAVYNNSADMANFTCAWQFLAQHELETQLQNLEAAHIKFDAKVRTDLGQYFAMRLYKPLFNVIQSYYQSRHIKRLDSKAGLGQRTYADFEFWCALFDRQPVVLAVIGEIYCDWKSAVSHMLDRLASDQTHIKTHIWQVPPARELKLLSVSCGLGDPHRGGQSVAILTTDIGDVVYKPKNLLGTQHTVALLQGLHQINPGAVPLAPKFLNQGPYGWEEKVAAKPCQTRAQVQTYYTRLGAWLRLLQILNANDFWYDNLIACADMPYFIDYETVVGYNFNNFNRSALAKIGILPMNTSNPNPQENAIDIGCMVAPGIQKTPLSDQRGHINMTARDFAVFLGDEFIDINAHFMDFEHGFVQMNDLLRSDAGQALMATFLHDIRAARFRHIFIDTWSAYTVIDRVTQLYKTDGVRRAIAHDQLFSWLGPVAQNNFTIIESAINSIWRNDIPIYEIQADTRHAYSAENEVIKDMFPCSVHDLIQKHMGQLDRVEEDLAEVRTLYSLRQDEPKRPYKIAGQAGVAKTGKDADIHAGNADQVEAMVYKIADSLQAHLLRADDLGQVLHLHLDHLYTRDYSLENLHSGFDGASGLLILFTRLCELGADKYRPLTERLYAFIAEDQRLRQGGYYGLSTDATAALVAFNEARGLFDVKPHIDRYYGEIFHNLSQAKQLCHGYDLGIEGLLSAFLLSHKNGLLSAGDWQAMCAQVGDKQLIHPQISPNLRTHLSRVLPDAHWGHRLLVHYNGGAIASLPAVDQAMGGGLDHGWDHGAETRAHESQPEPKSELKTATRFANLNAQIILKSHQRGDMAAQIANLLGGDPAAQDGKTLLNALYSSLYLRKYGYSENEDIRGMERGDIDSQIGQISLCLINRFRLNGRWFCDQWADDRHLLSMRHGLVDMALAFLAQIPSAGGAGSAPTRALNPARLLEM